ncbi:MAG: peptidyl-prolyl cis-trans isomerase [Nevskiales bacterium]
MNLRIAGYCIASFLAGTALTLKLARAYAPTGESGGSSTVIAITPAQHQALEARHEMDRWLDDELLFREGLRRGYALDDLIVRRELQRRARETLLAEHPVPAASDAVLQTYLEQHADRYQAPALYTFEQVYLSRGAHGAQLEADALALGARLRANPDGFAKLGDPFPNGGRRVAVSAARIVSEFGLVFAQGVTQLPADGWHGPMASALGAHWVRLERIEPGRPLALAEVRARVATDYAEAEKQDALRLALASLRGRYRVVDDPSAVSITRRVTDENEIP